MSGDATLFKRFVCYSIVAVIKHIHKYIIHISYSLVWQVRSHFAHNRLNDVLFNIAPTYTYRRSFVLTESILLLSHEYYTNPILIVLKSIGLSTLYYM